MKTTTAACAALLQGFDPIYSVDLLTLTLLDGTVIRWANADIDVSYGGATWTHGPVIERDAVRLAVGLEVQTCAIKIYCTRDLTIAGVPLLDVARKGGLGGAWIKLERGIAAQPGAALAGTVHLHEGPVGQARVMSTHVSMDVRSITQCLDVQIPPDVYQAPCERVLYSAGCGVSKAAHTLNLSAQAGSTSTALACAVDASSTYALGVITCLSGSNAGLKRAVKAQAAGVLTMAYPWPDAPQPGDQFQVLAGCDKTMGTCNGKFNNLPRFKGHPFIPVQETAL